MSLSDKHKIILWSFLLALGVVIFFVLRSPYMRVRSVVRTYNRWTDPAAGRGGLLKLFIASKYGTSTLKKVVDKNCEMIVTYNDGHVEYGTGYNYIDSMKGKWFVYNVDRIILSGPVIEPNDDGYIAKMTELLYEKSEIGLWERELLIKKYGSRYLISKIKWVQKTPTDKELRELQDMIKVKRYDPRKGFGGRYNELYKFSRIGFSPDGEKIAFSAFTPKSSDIYIVNVTGSGLKRLTKTKYWEVAPQFTPDGKHIMFLSDKENYGGEYYLIDLDGSNYRRLAPDYFGVAEACYSPDSRYVAFISQKGTVREVYIMDADGNDTRQLTNSGNDCSSLKFSPDGEKLFFVQQWYDENEKPPLNEEIFSINVDGTDLRQLTQAKTEKAHNKQVLDVTNDHVFFLHVTFHEYNGIPIGQQSNDHEVWQMAHNGSRQKRIIGGGMTTGFYEETKVLPNGRSIVFVDSLRHSIPVLQIKDLNGPDKTLQLANTGACNSKIAVSPDSRYVAYMLLPRLLQNAETRGIGIVSVDGKESRSIGENWIKE